MTCRDVLELVEPIAAGDIRPDEQTRRHLESCPGCAAALARARRVEAALAALETPAAPAQFTAAVMARIRRERWRAEQHVDWLFNVAIATAVLLVIVGVIGMTNLTAVLALAASAWDLFGRAAAGSVRGAAPGLGTYLAAAGLLATALLMWWYAERRFSGGLRSQQ